VERKLFPEEHNIFRDAFRRFLEKEVVPRKEEWEKAGMASRDVWLKAGGNGFLCPWLPEEYGGYGYMLEYPICKDYMDVRVQTIFAGTTEIMKEVIGRRMGL